MTQHTPDQKIAIIHHAITYVKKLVGADTGGHDWPHIERVRQMAVRIAKAEGIDPFLPELMAIVHDVVDRKIAGYGQEAAATEKLQTWLIKHGLVPEEVTEIIYVITNQSYSASGLSGLKLDSVAGQIMQDADRLEAIGAIGIARCFAYNGKKGNPIYDPTQPIRTDTLTAEEYKKDKDASINHFYEKLLKLKDLMNTKTAQALAAERHQFMENYLKEFFAEWSGEK